jgi:hypothetical protein
VCYALTDGGDVYNGKDGMFVTGTFSGGDDRTWDSEAEGDGQGGME